MRREGLHPCSTPRSRVPSPVAILRRGSGPAFGNRGKPGRRLRFVQVGSVALALILAACGRKAPVKSPELAAPQAISDLRAANTVDGVMLTWSRPRQYVDGTTLDALGRFVVERAEAAVPGAFATITTLEVNDRERFRQTRTFRYLDHGPVVGSAYLYRVTAGTTDGYFSVPSNTAVVQREVPPENIRENSPPKTP